MRLLLDSHILVWWWEDDVRLRPAIRDRIRATRSCSVSLASYWELGVKIATGRLKLPGNLDDLVSDDGFEVVGIERRHAVEAMHLPPHHSDPFDRMLIAQALCEDMTLVTADRLIRLYDVPILAA
jgi:PIN domain nuclease of toxin-antitoxin system